MQQQKTEIDVHELADKPELWSDNTLSIDENGHVDGSAYIFDRDNEIDVNAHVVSYDYERGGERRTNHVPMVVVTEPNGKIKEEPHCHDSSNPRTAIERAISTAEWAYDEYQ